MENNQERPQIFSQRLENTYPTIGQGFLLLLVIIGVSSIIQLMFAEWLMGGTDAFKSFSFFLIYTLSFGLSFLLVWLMAAKVKIAFQAFNTGVLGYIFLASILLIIVRLPLLDLIPIPENIKEQFEDLVFFDIWGFLTLAVAAPILEELIFRGIILRGFLKNHSVARSIFASAVIFGIAHLNPWQFISAFFLGIFIGWIYYRTASIWPCIFVHFVNNAAVFFVGLFTEDKSGMEEMSLDYNMANILFLLFAAGLLFLSIRQIDKLLPRGYQSPPDPSIPDVGSPVKDHNAVNEEE